MGSIFKKFHQIKKSRHAPTYILCFQTKSFKLVNLIHLYLKNIKCIVTFLKTYINFEKFMYNIFNRVFFKNQLCFQKTIY